MIGVMVSLSDFLLSRVEEDAQLARAAAVITSGIEAGALFSSPYAELSDHIVRWDPTRALAECEATRRVIELFDHAVIASDAERLRPGPDAAQAIAVAEYGYKVLWQLAQAHTDHRDFRKDWKPVQTDAWDSK
ncbi:DUF6221 family protein [Pengzhenrongella frigida]|uniref:Uncharacterized protein n=1 Tax=Pengzhenrongella frigida TaxID=1259133 RepID=A0A4Q5MZ35_9MICO|nr:DUF6221 family protein [Cellulomonas sp. HLT2-17]RYV50998.1 hypothetical protein EUA98_10850 [Cellulomonas sp. HLT2-17]